MNSLLKALRNRLSITAIALGIAISAIPAISLSTGAFARDPIHRPRCLESALQTILKNAPPYARVRQLDEIRELRIATYNLLNLREHVGKFSYSAEGRLVAKKAPRQAEIEKVVGKARAIREIDPDILVAQEVEGGLRNLQRFADEELDGLYNAYLADGNDSRGINIGFLVKKDLPITIEMETHRAASWVDPTRIEREPSLVYSRDLPALIIRTPMQRDPDKPLLVILGNHSKSMRDRPGDPLSKTLRKAQTDKTAEIVSNYRTRFGSDARIIVGGDFNMPVESRELRSLAAPGLAEAFTIAKKSVPTRDRVTHTFHPRDGPRQLTQLDAFFVSPGLRGDVSRAWVYRYRNAQGKPLALPRTYAERELNPSDHYPLVMGLDFQPVLKRFRNEQHPGK